MTAATFFAKIDEQVQANEKETKHVSKQFANFQADFVNPSQELDGKVYAMNMKIAAAEMLRESQFTTLKDALKKLVFSLENRNQSNS